MVWVHRLILADVKHGPTLPRFLLCLGAVVLLMAGLALVVAGANLFRPQPKPPRALLP
jgi:hypothetical protein